MATLAVYKRRTNVVSVKLGIDVSADTITSEIRVGKSYNTPLIVEWDVAYLTDGTDGEMVFTLDDSVLQDIPQSKGYMDIKRVSDGEPYAVIKEPITVMFKNVVTE